MSHSAPTPRAPTARRLAALTLAPLALVGLVAACGLGGLEHDRMIVATLVSVPALVAPGGQEIAPAGAAADLFWGQKAPGANPLVVPSEGLPGATARVERTPTGAAAEALLLADQGDGHYVGTSADAPALAFAAGDSLLARVVSGGESFSVGPVVAPPADPPLGLPVPGVDAPHPLGEHLPVSRAGALPAFVTVFELGAGGPVQTWTNLPAGVTGLLNVAFNPSPWEVETYTIPGDKAFPRAGSYAVVITAVARGETADPLYSGSSLYVGAGAGAVVVVQ